MKKTSCCVLLLVSVSLLLLSCGAGSSNNGGGVGCNAQQGTTCQSLTINGVTRTYLLHVPSNFQKGSSPLVIVLHGSGATDWEWKLGLASVS